MKRGSIVILALVVVAVVSIIAFKLVSGLADDTALVPIETLTGGIPVAAGPAADTGLTPAEQLDQALAAHRPVFVLFHSTTCIPCKEMEKIVARVRPDLEDRVVFVDVIVGEARNQDLNRQMGIRVIPTSIIFDAQGHARQGVGVIAEDTLRAELQKLAEQQP
ncbi:MAG: thioredoxin family protein [Chloroflexi bacterium]|nr:thioredoxin family protein [Chloroflexota bacterium]MBU1751441.1 thioredoxin family protein [Chloroflexota bacterium]